MGISGGIFLGFTKGKRLKGEGLTKFQETNFKTRGFESLGSEISSTGRIWAFKGFYSGDFKQQQKPLFGLGNFGEFGPLVLKIGHFWAQEIFSLHKFAFILGGHQGETNGSFVLSTIFLGEHQILRVFFPYLEGDYFPVGTLGGRVYKHTFLWSLWGEKSVHLNLKGGEKFLPGERGL